MKLTRYEKAADFLAQTRAALEREEAANNLILGIVTRLAEHPEQVKFAPYLGAVHDGPELVAAAVRTPPHRVILFSARHDESAALQLLLDDLLDFTASAEPFSDNRVRQLPGVVAHSATALAFAKLWSERTGRSFRTNMSQRIYKLRQVNRPETVPGRLRSARESEMDLISDWVYNFSVDAHLPADREEARTLAELRIESGDIFVWEDAGRAVSIAGKSRPSRHGMSISLVYTPPEFRNRGYASACVAALSQQLLDAGWEFCTLYTDLANPTSNSIYQRIGYRPVCDSHEYDFTGN